MGRGLQQNLEFRRFLLASMCCAYIHDACLTPSTVLKPPNMINSMIRLLAFGCVSVRLFGSIASFGDDGYLSDLSVGGDFFAFELHKITLDREYKPTGSSEVYVQTYQSRPIRLDTDSTEVRRLYCTNNEVHVVLTTSGTDTSLKFQSFSPDGKSLRKTTPSPIKHSGYSAVGAGKYYLGDGGNIYVYSGVDWRPLANQYPWRAGVGAIRGYMEDASGNLLIVAEDKLYKFSSTTNTFEIIRTFPGKDISVKETNGHLLVQSIVKNKDDFTCNIWICDRNGKVTCVDQYEGLHSKTLSIHGQDLVVYRVSEDLFERRVLFHYKLTDDKWVKQHEIPQPTKVHDCYAWPNGYARLWVDSLDFKPWPSD